MRYLLFSLGDERYALDVRDVLAVRALPTYKSLPGTPPWVAGLASDDEGTFPVIDLCALAVNRPARSVMSTRLVLLSYRRGKSAPGADADLDAESAVNRLGVIVERATSTMTVEEGAFVSSGLATPEAPYLGPIYTTPEGAVIQRIRIDDLLPGWVHERLYPQQP